jgi:carbon storage regulator
MLLITRRAGERIVLGDDIIIEVIEVSGSQVRVGVHAPRSVPIYREEIWEAVKAENRAAAEASQDALARVKKPRS